MRSPEDVEQAVYDAQQFNVSGTDLVRAGMVEALEWAQAHTFNEIDKRLRELREGEK